MPLSEEPTPLNCTALKFHNNYTPPEVCNRSASTSRRIWKHRRQDLPDMPATPLTHEHIHAALESLPVQARIMLHLLMLQYFDVPQDEIEFMAADRPDPRLQSGTRLKSGIIPKDAVQNIVKRIG